MQYFSFVSLSLKLKSLKQFTHYKFFTNSVATGSYSNTYWSHNCLQIPVFCWQLQYVLVILQKQKKCAIDYVIGLPEYRLNSTKVFCLHFCTAHVCFCLGTQWWDPQKPYTASWWSKFHFCVICRLLTQDFVFRCVKSNLITKAKGLCD